MFKGIHSPNVAKGHLLYKLWRNLQKYLSCLILEPNLLGNIVILLRNPATALGTIGNFLLNIKSLP